MLKNFRDIAFLRLLGGSLLVLGTLAFLSFRLAWPSRSPQALSGTYQRASVPFLHVDALPEKMVLVADGPLSLHASDGSLVFQGHWRWDGQERIIRVDDPRWDRQIRLRSTLFGVRMSMRVSELPLELDHPEHDEEVDFDRTSP